MVELLKWLWKIFVYILLCFSYKVECYDKFSTANIPFAYYLWDTN